MEAIPREFIVTLPWKLFYADDLVVIAVTEDGLLENRGMRVNMNKTKIMITGECQNLMQKAARWLYGVCGRGVVSNSIQCTSLINMSP